MEEKTMPRMSKKEILGDTEYKTEEKVSHNTYKLVLPDDTIIYRFYVTDIITMKDGKIIFNTGGERTATTKQRMNSFQEVATIQQKEGAWYANTKTGMYLYQEGMSFIMADGAPVGDYEKIEPKKRGRKPKKETIAQKEDKAIEQQAQDAFSDDEIPEEPENKIDPAVKVPEVETPVVETVETPVVQTVTPKEIEPVEAKSGNGEDKEETQVDSVPDEVIEDITQPAFKTRPKIKLRRTALNTA
jgi:hypothetical protein